MNNNSNKSSGFHAFSGYEATNTKPPKSDDKKRTVPEEKNMSDTQKILNAVLTLQAEVGGLSSAVRTLDSKVDGLSKGQDEISQFLGMPGIDNNEESDSEKPTLAKKLDIEGVAEKMSGKFLIKVGCAIAVVCVGYGIMFADINHIKGDISSIQNTLTQMLLKK